MGNLVLPWYKEVDGERERICEIIRKKYGASTVPYFYLEIINVHGTKQYYHKKALRVGSIEQADKLTQLEAEKAIQKIVESKAKVKTNLIEAE
jgi:GTP1/Obg family GTP-binding protein